MAGAALVVIDMQEAALVPCEDAAIVIDRINGLSRRARSAGAPVVFVQHEDDEFVKGTHGWQLAAQLDRSADTTIVEKRYRDGFAETRLEEVLRDAGAKRIVVTGAHSDLCVLTTALSALAHGFDLTLVDDGHIAMPADLPGGTLPAATVEELVNARFTTLRYPGRTVEVVPAANVVF